MSKSFETLKKEHTAAVISLGEVQKKTQSLSVSLLKRGKYLTLTRAKELTNKPILFDGKIWYMTTINDRKDFVSSTGWVVDHSSMQKITVRLQFPDESYLGGIVFPNEGPIVGLLETISTAVKDLVAYYEKKAKKEVKVK